MHVKTREEWLEERDELLDELRRFAQLYRKRPFDNEQGLRGVSAFALYWFLRRLQPTVVFEVGVWKGFSTWIIEQAAPNAEIHCFDPVFYLEPLLDRKAIGKTYRPAKATRSTQDFSCTDVASIVSGHERPVAFLDDHQNALPRLRQCRAFGIRELIFDDNDERFPTHRMLETERRDPASSRVLDAEIHTYEIFPALWPVDAEVFGQTIREEGLGLPVDKELEPLFDERIWHSSVTHVRLRELAAP